MLYNNKMVNPKIVTLLIFLLELEPDPKSGIGGPGTNPEFVNKFK
jgi:hypothetical protein